MFLLFIKKYSLLKKLIVLLNSPEVTKHNTFIIIQTDKWLKK